ncbi:MAG: phosphoenolpyruvate carboxykinase (GTP), partial [Actinobacteria bacterium]|nr:phosphoenolpyruvate carboxykinase (GTP) [Actinomycetota bacterium]
LKWIVDRIDGKAQGVETPIGILPAQSELYLDGLDITAEDLDLLLSVDTEVWKQEAAMMPDYFEQFGTGLGVQAGAAAAFEPQRAHSRRSPGLQHCSSRGQLLQAPTVALLHRSADREHRPQLMEVDPVAPSADQQSEQIICASGQHVGPQPGEFAHRRRTSQEQRGQAGFARPQLQLREAETRAWLHHADERVAGADAGGLQPSSPDLG